jgi:hypothetical protein
VPPDTKAEKNQDWNEKDIIPWRTIGSMGKEITGYYPRPGIWYHGLANRWHYTHLGIYGWTPELWNFLEEVGLGDFAELEKKGLNLDTLNEEDGLKVLEWNDRELDGKGFLDWTEFDHPQLGRVEIGGWKTKFVVQNPPEKLLEAEIDKAMMFPIKHAALLPLIRINNVKVAPIDNGLFRIKVTIQNTGFLPTNITQKAIELKKAKPVIVELLHNKEVELLSGKNRIDVGYLEGRSDRLPTTHFRTPMEERSKISVEWLVRARKLPTKVEVVALSEKGGRDKKNIMLAI